MSATATCDVCKINASLDVSPMGLAQMPLTWFCTVRDEEGTYQVVDVCSTLCAEAYDKAKGRNSTKVMELIDGEAATRTIEHKAAN